MACRPVDILPPSLHQLGRRANRHDMRRTDVQASEPRTDTHRRRSRSQLGTDLPARNALFLGLHFYLLFALDGTEAEDSFFPIGIPITIWPLISVLHFSLSIVGGVKAGRGRTMGFYGVPLARARPRRPESRIRRTSSRSTGLSASILIDWRAVDMMEILALTLPSSRGSDPTIDREHQEKHKQKPAEHEEDERTIEH